MTLKLFDAHTHVQFAAYDKDREEVIKRAYDAEVGMINVGTQRDTSKSAVELAETHKNMWAAIGLHPIHTSKSYHDPEELGGEKGFTSRGEEFDHDYYKKLAEDPKVIAIGECGLDYFRDKEQETRDKQKEVFINQIKLSHEVKKPLMIHCRSAVAERTSPQNGAGRNAFGDLIDLLTTNYKPLTNPPGIIHFFSGAVEDAKKLLDLGFYFTFGGVITFPPRLAEQGQGEAGVRDYDKVIKTIPIDRVLSETDAPYVTPVPYRGKRNEPAYVIEVVKKLAELKDVSTEEMAAQILVNAEKVFSINLSN